MRGWRGERGRGGRGFRRFSCLMKALIGGIGDDEEYFRVQYG